MPDYSKYDVVLLPTFIQVEDWRRQRALEQRAGLFGQAVTTFSAWIADLWELYGDGRRLVDSIQRQMVMRVAFSRLVGDSTGEGVEETDVAAPGGAEDSLTLSPGIAPLAARCEQAAAGVAEYDAAVAAADTGTLPAGISLREGVFLQGIARYRELLGRQGMVEPGEACRWLAARADEVFPRPLRVLVENAAPLDWRAERFFAACGQLAVEVREAPGADGIGRAPDGVAVRFAFPAGRYATPGLVADVLDGLAPGQTAVVTAKDPLSLYRQMEQALAGKGLQAAVQAQVPFGATDVGRAYLLLSYIRNGAAWDAASLADVVRSPFCGLTPPQAEAFDARLRADRLAEADSCLAELRETSEGFAMLMDAVGDDAWKAAIDAWEARVRDASGRSAAWKSEQLVALAGLRSVREAGAVLGANWLDRQTVLEQMAVSVPYRGVVAGSAQAKPAVLVTTQGAAAQLGRASCAMLVACDLTADAYPLADKDDAAATLFAKLGLLPADDVLARSRRMFTALVQAPTREFVCVRPLNDVDGNPAYACAMLEEFVDAYRPAEAEAAGGADPDALPDALAAGICERGEESLFANALAAHASVHQRVSAVVPIPQPGLHGATEAQAMLPPRRVPDDAPVLRSPSPSQVEVYLECPYKWFVQRRLGIERLEEGFGALERGTFAHAVLERFYRRFTAEGRAKVAPENLDEARRILREEADVVEAEMRQAAAGSGRLVATTKLEQHELEQLKEQLGAFLDYESQVLPGFHPAYLEYPFREQDAVEYAGCAMVGTVDRIDVDDAGRAVIIDYKGSVNPEHDIADKDAAHPGKIQTRIYAQMVKRALGLDVVGAIYLSYGKKHALAGAVDARVIESAHLPGARKDAMWCLDTPAADGESPEALSQRAFADMLDATESIVADAVERMERGEVAPAPSTPDACRYCPVAQCPKKGA